jgi:hypothetical protein
VDRIDRFTVSGPGAIPEGRFYSARSLHQHAESGTDEDWLHVDTGETRVIVDPR